LPGAFGKTQSPTSVSSSGYSVLVATCIYCLEVEPAVAFVGVEHVMMKAFGGFRDNLTLSRAVCDGCNAFFSGTLDLYLARDTPYGIARFISGAKSSSNFKGVGPNSQMTHVIDEGVLAGAEAHLTAGPERLNLKPPEQLGFGSSPEGPLKWFPVDRLPSKAQLRLLFPSGDIFVHLLESEDPQSTLAKLEAVGFKVLDVTEVANPRPPVIKAQTRAYLGSEAARAFAKIGLNYLAHQCGMSMALRPEFNATRRFIRFGVVPPWRVLTPNRRPPVVNGSIVRNAHVVSVYYERRDQSVRAEVSLHSTPGFSVALAVGGFIMPPQLSRAHLFDLSTMEARPMKVTA
jgi:hypothetical protein